MKKITKKLAGLLIPSSLKNEFIYYKEINALKKLTNSDYLLNNLMCAPYNKLNDSLKEIFKDPINEKDWLLNSDKIAGLDLPDMTGGVNRGDQKAIFYLINHFKPKNVLEIGTHIGCSTVHIALALKQIQNSRLTTVDIIDVNEIHEKRWLNYNSKHSPSQLMSLIGSENDVKFVKDDSINFLKNCQEKFDFIFLDGSHEAKMVYQEIPLALKLLNENGVILLHDYFPGNKPIWSNEHTIPGPYLAVSKIIGEEQNISVVPLGELPWETKINSCYTSLALLHKLDLNNYFNEHLENAAAEVN